jgi:hypothetical protein
MKPMQLLGGEPRWGTLATYYEPAPADASSLDRGNPGRRVHSPRRWRNLPANALASVSFFGRTQCRDRDCDVAKMGLHLRCTRRNNIVSPVGHPSSFASRTVFGLTSGAPHGENPATPMSLMGPRLCENSDALLQSRIFASSSGNQSREILPTSIVAARRTKRFSVPLVKTRFHTAWVMGCRHDYVGSTTGVPQLADNCRPAKLAESGQLRTLR